MSDKKYNVNLPRTDFAMRAGLPKQEPKWLEKWQRDDIYTTLLKKRENEGAENFILHCGPPYANGSLHMGHALSYMLKDFVVRSKSMSGLRTPFVPGWDCHGLPIEWKIEQDLRKKGQSKNDLSVKELRDLCRDYADHWIDVQKNSWKRYGVFADLDNPYLTKAQENEAGIVRALGKIAGRGHLYRGVKSVHWSTVEQTALAEAEIEYADKTSTAIYVSFPWANAPDEEIVIWTTTPWTMPANRAIAFGDEVAYSLFEATNGKKYWLANTAALLEAFSDKSGLGLTKIRDASAGEFADTFAIHPLYKNRKVPLVSGEHVTTDAGTGFVHTAPAHGYDDFLLGKKHNLPLECPVDGGGLYEPFVDADSAEGEVKLAGQHINKSYDAILEALGSRLVCSYPMTHSYPVSWRSKAPLIFRTTPQWFMKVDGDVREACLTEIKNTQWIPSYGEKRLTSMVENRPDWCLSRQRSWGVPITIFTDKTTGEPLLDEAAFEAVAKQIEKHGIDAWETLSAKELLAGYDYAGDVANLEKETDILDVWFDSGTTWLHVLGARDDLPAAPADLYLEGSDQHRGWFQTSLLSSVSATGKAPYKAVLTHGFVVDGNGRKMSKSVGNVVDPQKLIDQYGADIVRLWVAGSDYAEDVRLSDEIIKTTTDSYRQFRNTFRYLLGNLHDFTDADKVAYESLPALEKWVLARLSQELNKAKAGYESYKFHEVISALRNFCATDLNMYFDVRKDVLYCEGKNSQLRRSTQTVLHALLNCYVTYLAPLLSFTCEEVYQAWQGDATGNGESVHLQTFADIQDQWRTENLTPWTEVFAIRDRINLAIENQRQELAQNSDVKIPNGVAVTVNIREEEQAALSGFGDKQLTDLLCVLTKTSSVSVGDELSIATVTHSACPRCWRHTGDITDTLCQRCEDAEKANNSEAAA